MSDIPKFGAYKGMMTSYEESMECQMCHAEDSSVLDFCQDCYDEMKGESDEAGQEFNKYWEIEDE